MEGPNDLCYRLQARPAKRHTSHLESFSLPLPFFSRRLSIPRFLLYARAASRCPCLTEMDVDREMCRLACFLDLHLVFVKLESFHALQHASSVLYSL